MSESIEASPISYTLATKNIASVSTGDLQNIQAAFQLNGKNNLKWSQLVRKFIKDGGNLRFFWVWVIQKKILNSDL